MVMGTTDEDVPSDAAVAAVVDGTDLQHAIVSGAGARPVDSMGNSWRGSYVTTSGEPAGGFHLKYERGDARTIASCPALSHD